MADSHLGSTIVGSPAPGEGSSGDIQLRLDGVPKMFSKIGDTWYQNPLFTTGNGIEKTSLGLSVQIDGKSVANFGDTIRLGKKQNDTGRLELDASGNVSIINRQGTTDTTVISLEKSGTIVIGDVAQNNIQITDSTLKLRDATSAIITLNNDGTASFNSSIEVGSYLSIKGFKSRLDFADGAGDGGRGNVIIGDSDAASELTDTTDSKENVIIGSLTLQNAEFSKFGVYIGYSAGRNLYDDLAVEYVPAAQHCVAVGAYALMGTSDHNVLGAHNTSIGSHSMYNFGASGASAAHNTCIGAYSGATIHGLSNVIVGAYAGTKTGSVTDITVALTGDGCTFLGTSVNPSAVDTDNEIVIGHLATGLGENKAVIGNTSITDVYMAEDSGASVHCTSLTLAETTTPTALADHGKVYTKSDNKLYFQDGAGSEHELAFV